MNNTNHKPVDWSCLEETETAPASALDRALAYYAETNSDPIADSRRETLERAVELGASDEVLRTLCDALRVGRNSTTVVLPAHRFEHLSRGRGWARQGKGSDAVWGERVDGGYRVGPGKWSVGATDGFRRKASDDWDVKHVTVGTETWTVAF